MCKKIDNIKYECTYKDETGVWIYAADNKCRYVFGKYGEKPLICFGINPSSACIDREKLDQKSGLPEINLDPTMINVKNVAEKHPFDGFIMLNLYPLIDSDPAVLKSMNQKTVEERIAKNMEYIGFVLDWFKKSDTLWACWGNSIMNGDYLIDSLEKINKLVTDIKKKRNLEWKTIKWTKTFHPYHPLMLSSKEMKNDFWDVDMDQYIRMLREGNWMEKPAYIEFNGAFPVCNHIEGVNPKYNHGYVQGTTGGGIPFEAELWSTDTEKNISILFPEEFDMYEGMDPYEETLVEHDPDGRIPYQRQDELVGNGILTIGMVERERINNINVIIAYVDYFEQCGLYQFVTEYRNGSLFQVTDVNGTDLLQLNITTWRKDMGDLAETDLNFQPFIKTAGTRHTKVLTFPRKGRKDE